MRLVIDGRRLTAGRTGVGRYLESLLREWATTGPPLAETLLVMSDSGGLDRVPACDGLRAEVIGEGWPGLAWERWGLGRRLQAGDLLFAPANLVPRGWRGPTVLVIHDAIQEARPESFPWHVRWRFAARYRRSAERADRVLVPSHATARDVARIYGVPVDRLRVIPLAADPTFRPSPPDAVEARRLLGLARDPFFLFVGKRTARRNLSSLMTAFQCHRERHPDHRLVFAGPSAPLKFSAGCPGTGIVDAGFVAEPTLRGLMTDALALLYPSEYEGFGLPVVEAMACGCPVVTLKNSALIEAGGDAAWYVDRADAASLGAAMHAIATEPDRRAGTIARGFLQAAGFRQDNFARAVKEQLREVAATATGGSRPPA